MSTKCETVARHILPLYRALIAKELIEKHGYTQVQTAKKLGTTQAAISQYVTSKRGHKNISNYDTIAEDVQAAAVKTAKRLSEKDMSREEFGETFCELCVVLRKTKMCY
jgi:predicted transcriptional regulator